MKTKYNHNFHLGSKKQEMCFYLHSISIFLCGRCQTKQRCLESRTSLFSLGNGKEAAKRGFFFLPLFFFRVMNGVKRSETRARPRPVLLSAAWRERACHLPPLEMRYKSPLRNKFMNTLLAFRAARYPSPSQRLSSVRFPLPILSILSSLEPLESS